MQPLAKAPMMQNSFEVEADQTFPQIDFTNLGLDDEGKPIEFPDLPYYGFDHGDKTAKLATVILSHQGPAAQQTRTPQSRLGRRVFPRPRTYSAVDETRPVPRRQERLAAGTSAQSHGSLGRWASTRHRMSLSRQSLDPT